MSMHTFEIRIQTPGDALTPWQETGESHEIELVAREATRNELISRGYTTSVVLDMPEPE